MKKVSTHPELLAMVGSSLADWNFITSEDSLNIAQLFSELIKRTNLIELPSIDIDGESTIYMIDANARLIVGPVNVLVYYNEFDLTSINF
jgi:hypothetical protein